MRPRAQTYHTLDGLSTERNDIAWYWRLVAVGSGTFILGGYVNTIQMCSVAMECALTIK